jgi:hypothetical protein
VDCYGEPAFFFSKCNRHMTQTLPIRQVGSPSFPGGIIPTRIGTGCHRTPPPARRRSSQGGRCQGRRPRLHSSGIEPTTTWVHSAGEATALIPPARPSTAHPTRESIVQMLGIPCNAPVPSPLRCWRGKLLLSNGRVPRRHSALRRYVSFRLFLLSRLDFQQ